jgi:hypothetical protein
MTGDERLASDQAPLTVGGLFIGAGEAEER